MHAYLLTCLLLIGSTAYLQVRRFLANVFVPPPEDMEGADNPAARDLSRLLLK